MCATHSRQIADWLNQNGIATLVLKYRLVRSRAKEWGVDAAHRVLMRARRTYQL